MGYQNSFLFRESLLDVGIIPTSHSLYSSPDIICHKLVDNPNDFFSKNYNQDVSERVKLGSNLNFMYARVKNISTDNTPVIGYVNIYRAASSLFMQPSLWKNNLLPTVGGNRSLMVHSVQPGEIVTGNDIFRLSGLDSDIFCLVGIVSDSPTPTVPESDFKSYNDYIIWIRNNQAVCARNLSTLSTTKRHYESLHDISNPEDEEREVFIRVKASDNLPAGTLFGVCSDTLGFQEERIINASGRNEFVVLTHLPPKYRTWISSYASLPSGISEWPAGGTIEVGFYVTMEPQQQAFRFSAPAANFGIRNIKPMNATPMHRLVQLGCCSTVFINR